MPTRKWGPEQLVNSTLSGKQHFSDVAGLAGGGFVVVWQGDHTVTDSAIRAQLYDGAGDRLGEELTIASAAGVDFIRPAVTALADGGFYVTFTQLVGPDNYILGGVYDAEGAFVRSQTAVFAFGQDEDSDVARLGAGTIVAWTDPDATDGDISFRIFDAAGAGGPILTANSVTASLQYEPAVAATPDASKAVIVWTSLSAGDFVIKARLFNTAGAEIAAEFQVNAGTGDYDSAEPVVTWLNDRTFAVAWKENGPTATGDRDILVRVFLADLAFGPPFPLTGEITVNSTIVGAQQSPTITALPSGGFVVAWHDSSLTGGDSSTIAVRLQAFDVSGGKIGGEFLVNTTTSGDQFRPAISALPDGRVVVTWEDYSSGGDADIRSQIVDPRDGIVTGTGGADPLWGHDLVNDEISGFAGNDVLRGMRGDDGLYGGEGNDTLLGQKGDDVGFGGAGNDLIDGGPGDDELYGEDGNDTFRVSPGEDAFHGGPGGDRMTFVALPTTTGVTVSLATGSFTLPGGQVQTFTSIEHIVGTAFADSLSGSNAANVLNGANGNDRLSGASGNDVLVGGLGADRLTGGGGADRFDFDATTESGPAAAARDTITDFQQGSDRIDLRTIDANTTPGNGGNQAFTFIGSAGFSAPGQVRAVQLNDKTIVQLSNDADTNPEMAMIIVGLVSLDSGDFIV